MIRRCYDDSHEHSDHIDKSTSQSLCLAFVSILSHRHVGDSDVVDVDDDARLQGGGHWTSSRHACVRGHV